MSEVKSAAIDFFLGPRSPKRLPKRLRESGKRSLLHLLRRDLCKLYGPETFMGYSDKPRHRAPVLAALGIFVGIDMMSTFACPSRMRSSPGERFKWFVKTFSFHKEEWQIEFLWDLRNAVAHQYTFRVEAGNFYRFTTDPVHENWVVKDGKIYTVNLWGLKDIFREMIRKYSDAVHDEGQTALRERFLNRYRSIGSMTAPRIS